MGKERVNHLVDSVASLDHKHGAAGTLEEGDEFLHGMGSDNLGAFRLVVDEFVDLGDCPIENGHLVAVVVHIQDQILAHYGQPDQSDVTTCLHISPVRFGNANFHSIRASTLAVGTGEGRPKP